MRILYLHGFASSPGSRKAQFFAEKLGRAGFPVEIVDLAEGDFEHLTIANQLRLIERVAANEPIALIGSSMGGYLAALYAARHPEVSRLILLAPAFDFHRLWQLELGPERLAAWERDGTLLVHHYALNREAPLSYGLMEDAARFEPFPNLSQPTLIFHGNQDAVVPVQQSVTYAAAHPNVQLVTLDSGHELTDVLDSMWPIALSFLQGTSGRVN